MTDMVDKVLDRCHATTSSLDPCLAWLIKAARPITSGGATAIINRSLQETVIRSIMKKPNLVADDIGNYRPVVNVSFLSKVVEGGG